MIKVGDRVRVYDFGCEADNEIWDGNVLEISKYQDIIVKVSNGDDDFWVFSKQCRKLVKRNKPNLKIGDRVRLPSGYEGKIQKLDIFDNTVEVLFDSNFGCWCDIETCTKVNKSSEPKFKIGDRVHAVVKDYNKDIKGTIEKIENAFYPIHHYFYYKLKEDEGWFTENTLKRLIKKKIEFKVGDRVLCKSLSEKSTIIAIDRNALGFGVIIICDSLYYPIFDVDPNDLKKLVKKKIVFKIGDRVSAGGQKGTIKQFHAKSDLAYVKFDYIDNSFIMAHPVDEFKKLRKKNIEFKVGDRVSVKGIFNSYGTIKSIDNKGILLYVHLDDYDRNIHFHPSECKKLVKKKKESPLISNALLNIVNNKEVLKSLEWAHQDNERWTCCALTDIDKRISMLETFQSLNADRFARIERSIKAK